MAVLLCPFGRSTPRPPNEDHQRARCAHPQSQEYRPGPAPGPAHRIHRPVGLRQVLARLRHPVRRGPATLRRIAVGLRAPVPPTHGKARRGPDRGALAGNLDRAKGHFAQPALHRRHGDRDPRLPAPALRAGRHPVLPDPQPAAGRAKRLADGRPRAGHAGRHQGGDPRARCCRAATRTGGHTQSSRR